MEGRETQRGKGCLEGGGGGERLQERNTKGRILVGTSDRRFQKKRERWRRCKRGGQKECAYSPSVFAIKGISS